MIAINKMEKDSINAQFPKVHIVRTMKQKSKRHRYYCEESKPVMRYLNKIRNGSSTANTLREGGNYIYTGRKNAKRIPS